MKKSNCRGDNLEQHVCMLLPQLDNMPDIKTLGVDVKFAGGGGGGNVEHPQPDLTYAEHFQFIYTFLPDNRLEQSLSG